MGDQNKEMEDMLDFLPDDEETAEGTSESEEQEEKQEENDEQEENDKDSDKDHESDEEEDDDDDEDDKDKELSVEEQLEAMRAQVADLTVKLAEKNAGDEPKSEEKEEKKEEKSDEEVKLSDLGTVDFIGETELDEALESKENLNKLLNKVVEASVQQGVQQTLRSLPKIIKTQVDTYTSMAEASSEFYKNNPDLAKFKPAMGVVAAELTSQHPEWEPAKLYEETGKELRDRLSIPVSKEESKPEKKEKQKGSFSKRSSGKRAKGQPKLSGMEKDVNDMLKGL
jgi:hypothetical protein